MSESEMGEDTYSLIFRSLKHPIRRRILRMLATKPMSYSEILEALSIDSGHLSYHLESLAELVIHTSDGLYKLSSIGAASTKLMSGVEEQKASTILPSKKQTILKIVTIASVILLVSALIPFSLFACQYTINTTAWERTYYVLTPSNQTFSHNFTIVYGGYPWEYSFDNHSSYFKRPMPVRGDTYWEEDYAVFRLEIPFFSYVSYRIYDSQGKLVLNERRFILKLIVVEWSKAHTEEENRTVQLYNLTDISPTHTLVLDRPISVDQAFNFELDAIQSDQPYSATLTVGLRRESFTKPYYYYGIAGFLIAAICPSLMLILWILTKRNPKDASEISHMQA